MYARLPSDLLRHIFSFSCTPKTVWIVSHVCTTWRHAIDHPTTWLSLCTHAGWELPRQVCKDRSLARAFFIERYRTIRRYSRGYWSRRSWSGHHAGILSIAIPPEKRFYSWTQGQTQSVDENVLISAASAPTYGLKIWKLDSVNRDGYSECVNEHQIFGNPLLQQTNDVTAAQQQQHNTNTNQAAMNAALDPLQASVKVHWSCVDIVTGNPVSGGNGCSSLDIPCMTDEASFGHTPSTSFSFSFASSPSSGSSVGSSPIAPPPPRPTNFLLFADMHTPVLCLYDLHSRRLRSFKSGHVSAICCVKASRFPAPRSFPRALRLAASGGYDHSVCIWDLDAGTILSRLIGGCKKTIWCVDVSSKLVAAGSDDGAIRLFKLSSRTAGKISSNNALSLTSSIVVDNCSSTSSDDDDDEDYTPAERLQKVREKRLREMREILSRKVGASTNNSGSHGSSCGMASIKPERPSRYLNDARFNGPPVDTTAVLNTQSTLAAQTAPSDDVEPKEFGGRLVSTLLGHTGSPMTLQFDPYSPDDKLWSAGYDKTIRLWNISNCHKKGVNGSYGEATCIRIFSGHTSVVFSLIITPHVLISTSRDGSVKLWDKDSGALIRDIEPGRINSDLVSEISAGSQTSEFSSLTSSRTQAFDIKCATRTTCGDIVTASSDGRISLIQFDSCRRRHAGVPSNTNINSPSMRRTNSGGPTSISTATRNENTDGSCAIM